MTVRLSQKNINELPETVAVPSYDRRALTPGILHIGVGNFHRAHQAVYLERLFNKSHDHDWGIVGAGIMPYDAEKREQLKCQDWLSTIIELDPEGYTARVCGAMIDFAEVSNLGLIAALCKPEIRIVSMTVTEGGYFVDPKTGGFNADHPDIQFDVKNSDTPKTVFGAIVAALQIRFSQNIQPFTIMSCDNLPHNGEVTKRTVIGLANMMNSEFADWIADNVAFPNGMVDCITPATGDRERQMAVDRFGIEDPSVVVCEPFRQWVLEDNFPQGRPALEKVGVEFVQDVAPYELMKLRILNGGHASLAYAAALLGIEYAHEAIETPVIRAFVEKLEKQEIIPTVSAVPGVDLHQYLKQTLERFSNAGIGDTIPRLCQDGSNRQPKFIFPTLSDRLEQGLPVPGLALELALWCRYCAGTDESGKSLCIDDENAERLQKNALLAKTEPGAFLGMIDIFGPMGSNEQLIEEFSIALDSLWKHGTKATLKNYTNEKVIA
ncbi:MAG: Multiple polyol-specific dehydrogenase (EC [uncultured Thiotrichaceae bacterium]|uniref:Multiple polyol-specific dehydrogenase (EC) n=1 Tax=uncultured Thiotrichaceae bacterium TaxID=298394 RepID=A0A6S6S9A3_9GAMM|nr:MAG: Multiple polyol-specific dehydrogenase (EC [uncultured Thiotrichaceae bacterium]